QRTRLRRSSAGRIGLPTGRAASFRGWRCLCARASVPSGSIVGRLVCVGSRRIDGRTSPSRSFACCSSLPNGRYRTGLMSAVLAFSALFLAVPVAHLWVNPVNGQRWRALQWALTSLGVLSVPWWLPPEATVLRFFVAVS